MRIKMRLETERHELDRTAPFRLPARQAARIVQAIAFYKVPLSKRLLKNGLPVAMERSFRMLSFTPLLALVVLRLVVALGFCLDNCSNPGHHQKRAGSPASMISEPRL